MIVLVDGEVDDVFALEPLFMEEGTDVGGLNDIPERLGLGLQVATL